MSHYAIHGDSYFFELGFVRLFNIGQESPQFGSILKSEHKASSMILIGNTEKRKSRLVFFFFMQKTLYTLLLAFFGVGFTHVLINKVYLSCANHKT